MLQLQSPPPPSISRMKKLREESETVEESYYDARNAINMSTISTYTRDYFFACSLLEVKPAFFVDQTHVRWAGTL